jgi:heme/copper-type cytochrome/quinol oxidase subunit 2
MLVHDYFGAANKKVNTNTTTKDPMSKGFDIRAFRIKQAAIREREAT